VGMLAAGIGLAGCQARASLDEEVQLTVGMLPSVYFSAARVNDAEGWADLYALDAVMMPPGGPAVEGRAAIAAWLANVPEITYADGTVLEVAGSGDVAYVRGTYQMALRIPGVEAPVGQAGKFLQVYERQDDDSWLLARDIWNTDAN